MGRSYATERHLTLGTLMDYLPQSNDPGCTAGFAHGTVTAVAPVIDPTRPGEAVRVCGSAHTRYPVPGRALAVRLCGSPIEGRECWGSGRCGGTRTPEAFGSGLFYKANGES